MKHEEKKKDEDEGPKFDERGEPLVIFKRTSAGLYFFYFLPYIATSDARACQI